MEARGFKLYEGPEWTETQIADRARDFRTTMAERRSLRFFSDKEVPASIITDLIMTAASAPSGANKQPWFFAAVSNAAIKAQIRAAAD